MLGKGRNKYTAREDKQLLQFLIRELESGNKDALQPKGNNIWNKAVDENLLQSHSRESMRDRMRRVLLPDLTHRKSKISHLLKSDEIDYIRKKLDLEQKAAQSAKRLTSEERRYLTTGEVDLPPTGENNVFGTESVPIVIDEKVEETAPSTSVGFEKKRGNTELDQVGLTGGDTGGGYDIDMQIQAVTSHSPEQDDVQYSQEVSEVVLLDSELSLSTEPNGPQPYKAEESVSNLGEEESFGRKACCSGDSQFMCRRCVFSELNNRTTFGEEMNVDQNVENESENNADFELLFLSEIGEEEKKEDFEPEIPDFRSDEFYGRLLKAMIRTGTEKDMMTENGAENLQNFISKLEALGEIAKKHKAPFRVAQQMVSKASLNSEGNVDFDLVKAGGPIKSSF